MRIHQLPSAVANQIAAGEVIERPASIVKELLENALDAKATMISIDIGYGGLNQVKISDNGQGIVADDLPLAIAAHATSKISKLKDLYSISSMGFRGEALASIASVSRLTISSKPAEQTMAMSLVTDGKSISINPCARNQGTTIDVRDIFFNAPVRKKFLKNERSEFQAIEQVVKRFALSAPQIAINLNHNGKPQLSLAAALCDKTRLARIRKLLGKTFIDQANYFQVEHGGLGLEGWVSTKNYQRSQNDKQWIYLNSRMVRDKLLNHALKQAYEGILYPGRHPACLLYFTITPEEVDVNVHPTKHEVRFQQPRLVHDFISSQIRQALAEPTAELSYKIDYEASTAKPEQLSEPYKAAPLFKKSAPALSSGTKAWTALNSSYALLFIEATPYMVDVASLQVQYLLSVLSKQTLPLASRPLLVPVNFSICSVDMERIKQLISLLEQVGILADMVGEQSLLIRTLPVLLPQLDLKPFLTGLLDSPKMSETELIALLCRYQTVDARQVRQEEAENLIGFMQGSAESANDQRTYYKPLSLKACSDFLNV